MIRPPMSEPCLNRILINSQRACNHVSWLPLAVGRVDFLITLGPVLPRFVAVGPRSEHRDRLPLQPGEAEKNGGFSYLGTVTWSVFAKSPCVHDMNALTLDETILFCG
jgi:hypothetical protein